MAKKKDIVNCDKDCITRTELLQTIGCLFTGLITGVASIIIVYQHPILNQEGIFSIIHFVGFCIGFLTLLISLVFIIIGLHILLGDKKDEEEKE